MTKTVEEPMTPEDIEAQKKGWREKIEKMRAQAKMPRPGEREVCLLRCKYLSLQERMHVCVGGVVWCGVV